MAAGLILYVDERLLVVHKPSGINTHRPDRFAPEGLHEYLSRRYGPLAVVHRLDKETSGVLVFGRNRAANQFLSRQFEQHLAGKEYLLLSDRRPTRQKFRAHTADAETEFEFLQPHGAHYLMAARPVTGKTHQIRRHAAANGFPILGDVQYGGAPAARLMLHAHRLSLEGQTFVASVPAVFDDLDPLTAAREFRELLFDDDTRAYRLISGMADGFPEVVVDSYAGHLLVQWQTERVDAKLYDRLPATAIVEQVCTKQKRIPPRLVAGNVTERFPVTENGLTFLAGFGEGLSTGLFMDQRENRVRLLSQNLTGKSVLNSFAYTCAFSVAAAKVGAVTTSVDLSRNYLEWGKDNFRANQLDPAGHEFVAGDVFEWFERYAKRGRQWDMVLVDPPTFSTTKQGRVFQAERDYAKLATLAAKLVKPGGTLFCSTNQRTLTPERFESVVRGAGRPVTGLEFATVPFDFRLAERERPYLKTFWATLA
jgi:23S rRNA (cytosine1962-C5)-methyltransferase